MEYGQIVKSKAGAKIYADIYLSGTGKTPYFGENA
jgi:hypothetical protein